MDHNPPSNQRFLAIKRKSRSKPPKEATPPPQRFLMIITSWNCRGMGSKKEEEALKDILKSSKASILLLQETKMSQQDVLRTLSNVCKGSQGVPEDARGASGGICTLWDASRIDMISSHICMHWIHTKVHHKSTGCQGSIFNIYAPQLLGEKNHCWDSLQNYL